MKDEYIFVSSQLTIRIKSRLNNMTYDIYINYDGEEHLLGTCYNGIYGSFGYDTIIYNENGVAILRTFDGKINISCAFNATTNTYIDDEFDVVDFYYKCLAKDKILGRKF